MTHFVARNGDVFESNRDPSSFDTHCYQKEGFGRICLLLNDQTEIDFLSSLEKPPSELRGDPAQNLNRPATAD